MSDESTQENIIDSRRIALLGLYMLSSMFSSETNIVEVKTAEVTIDSITQRVSASGKIQPEIEVKHFS